MRAGLFMLECPKCGAEIEVDLDGRAVCAGCDRVYLNRVGYLIPVDQHELDPELTGQSGP